MKQIAWASLALMLMANAPAADKPASSQPVPDDVAFCKEVLIQGLIVRLVNLGDKPAIAKLSLPGRSLSKAWACGTLEENRSRRALAGGAATCELRPRQVTTVRLISQ
jgi:hypothetical protein